MSSLIQFNSIISVPYSAFYHTIYLISILQQDHICIQWPFSDRDYFLRLHLS